MQIPAASITSLHTNRQHIEADGGIHAYAGAPNDVISVPVSARARSGKQRSAGADATS